LWLRLATYGSKERSVHLSGKRRPVKPRRISKLLSMRCKASSGRNSAAVDPDDPAEYKTVLDLSERMVQRANDMGGTCTGKHGFGIGKQKFLNREFGEAAVALMRTIKAAVDAHDIMNPGKLLPPE
jgi:hypothetical protein